MPKRGSIFMGSAPSHEGKGYAAGNYESAKIGVRCQWADVWKSSFGEDNQPATAL